MKALVTGGCGFIGKALSLELARQGHRVMVLDRWEQIANAPMHPNITAVGISLPLRLPPLEADWYFHLGAIADVIPSIHYPLKYFIYNVDATVHLLELARLVQVKKFVFASSTSIYGLPQRFPTPETEPASPRYPYSFSKWLAEESVTHWHQVYKLPTISLRPTTVYGPGMRARGAYGSVMKVFMAQKAQGKPFTVVGNGEQLRDFVHIDDVVRAFILAAQSDIVGEVYNVGFGNPTRVLDIIRLLGGGEIVWLPKRPGEPDITWADLTKIREHLGWQPQVPIKAGVAQLLECLEEWKTEKCWEAAEIEYITREWHRCLK